MTPTLSPQTADIFVKECVTLAERDMESEQAEGQFCTAVF